MKVLSIEVARATQFVLRDEVSPPGGNYLPEAFRLVTERYGFAIQPSFQDMATVGAKFQQGRLIAGSKKINVIELGFFNDGIAAATLTDTDDADFVIDDAMTWAQHALRFRAPVTKLPRWYSSGVVIQFNDGAVGQIVSVLEKTKRLFDAQLKDLYPWTFNSTFARIGLGSDPAAYPQHFKSEFFIERRINVPYENGMFFSSAPLKTTAHIALLESFEREAEEIG